MAAPHIIPDPDEAKRALRAAMRARRLAEPPDAATLDALRAALDAAVHAIDPDGPVAAIWPLPGEPDLRPLLRHWHEAGRSICLPKTHAPGVALTFHTWEPDGAMHDGPYGTRHPGGDPVLPSVMLVPLLAFDRRGHRLGYGGGFYDRTLAALPTSRPVGFGLSWQEVTDVPTGRYDRPLDMIVTEREVIRIGF